MDYFDAPIRLADGEKIDVAVAASPIKDQGGTILGISLIARDVSERVAAKTMVQDALDRERVVTGKLKDLDKLKDEFVAMVAHDLRSPLSVISGFASLMLSRWEILEDEQKVDYLQRIVHNTAQVSALADDILEIARMEHGEFSYVLAPFSLGDVVHRVAEELGAAAAGRIRADVPADLPSAIGDEARQRQILTNIVSNSLKYASETEAVEIVVTDAGEGMLQVEVRDRGAGINPDDIPSLFEKFRRIARPGAPARSGTGLGLYICKQMVEAQGGRIKAESRQGGGTVFTYSIPAAAEEGGAP